MVNKMKGIALFVLTCWKLNLAGAMEFRLSFLLTAGMMVINNAVWILFWGMYFARFQVVNGWTFQDVTMMWAVSSGGFGLSVVFFGNAYRLATLIASGQLDLFMSQPKPVLLHILISRMSVSGIGDIVFALILYGCFGNLSPGGIGKFVLALLLAMLIFMFFVIMVQSLAFFIGNAEGLGQQLFNGMLAFSTYPTGIFKGVGKLILFTVIPAGFISYLPIGLLRSVEPVFLLQTIGIAAALTAGGSAFFYYGLKRYSSGNTIGIRM